MDSHQQFVKCNSYFRYLVRWEFFWLVQTSTCFWIRLKVYNVWQILQTRKTRYTGLWENKQAGVYIMKHLKNIAWDYWKPVIQVCEKPDKLVCTTWNNWRISYEITENPLYRLWEATQLVCTAWKIWRISYEIIACPFLQMLFQTAVTYDCLYNPILWSLIYLF